MIVLLRDGKTAVAMSDDPGMAIRRLDFYRTEYPEYAWTLQNVEGKAR